jgi:hypothetical protein
MSEQATTSPNHLVTRSTMTIGGCWGTAARLGGASVVAVTGSPSAGGSGTR